ncbi:hypothetical protein [Rhizorhapis suberifaciens]|uniref:Uncharacterized protein n=1 Tax=Rhizorhapis suberifaciens TaxID=13656 RepID=A0A840HXB3_9SPHN|nr:hypothetical protein [Rhizorhapis suberifaciens]MBB4642247.1 hypothetical protein [Rhizorhapis suberifaciens]
MIKVRHSRESGNPSPDPSAKYYDPEMRDRFGGSDVLLFWPGAA